MPPPKRKSETVQKADVEMKETAKKEVEVDTRDVEMWTELYRPQRIQDLVGNSGIIENLIEWLRDWDDVVIKGNKKTIRPMNGKW